MIKSDEELLKRVTLEDWMPEEMWAEVESFNRAGGGFTE
jgi:hypothetical protein